jgi:hypothetical protein
LLSQIRQTRILILMASETSNRMKSIALAVAFGIVKSSVAFLPASTHKKWIASWGKEHYRTSTSDPLFGIAEWRDTLLDQFPGTKGRTLPITPGSSPKASNALPHEICVLPFSHEDCLVQGQTKNLHLHEDRYEQTTEIHTTCLLKKKSFLYFLPYFLLLFLFLKSSL